ncbi:MAG: hypothetical protein ABIZ05_14655 [Pseudonocardiaceae bacterium]
MIRSARGMWAHGTEPPGCLAARTGPRVATWPVGTIGHMDHQEWVTHSGPHTGPGHRHRMPPRLSVEVGGTVAAAGVVLPRLLVDQIGLCTELAEVMAVTDSGRCR